MTARVRAYLLEEARANATKVGNGDAYPECAYPDCTRDRAMELFDRLVDGNLKWSNPKFTGEKHHELLELEAALLVDGSWHRAQDEKHLARKAADMEKEMKKKQLEVSRATNKYKKMEEKIDQKIAVLEERIKEETKKAREEGRVSELMKADRDGRRREERDDDA